MLPSKRARSHSYLTQVGLEALTRTVEAGPVAMILAHWLSSRPDPFGQNLTQSAKTKLDPAGFA